MGLFKKKPGGTLIGNLIRKGANYASGGILGNGANRLPVGSTSPAADVSTSPVSPISTSPVNFSLADVGDAIKSFNKVANDGVAVKAGVNPTTIIGIGVAALVVVWMVVSGKKKSR